MSWTQADGLVCWSCGYMLSVQALHSVAVTSFIHYEMLGEPGLWCHACLKHIDPPTNLLIEKTGPQRMQFPCQSMRHWVTATEHVREVAVYQHLPPRHLLHLGLPSSLSIWISDFLTNPNTALRLGHLSPFTSLSTGDPQDCVPGALHPWLSLISHVYSCTMSL